MNQSNPTLKVVYATCILALILTPFLFSSCGNGKSEAATSEHDVLPEEKNRVETVVIHREDFTREIISNGKLSAIQKAELYFKTDGIIAEINVKNGQAVSSNTVLAALQNENLLFSLKQARMAMDKAEIEK